MARVPSEDCFVMASAGSQGEERVRQQLSGLLLGLAVAYPLFLFRSYIWMIINLLKILEYIHCLDSECVGPWQFMYSA